MNDHKLKYVFKYCVTTLFYQNIMSHFFFLFFQIARFLDLEILVLLLSQFLELQN